MEATEGATAALLTFLIDQILKEAQDQALLRGIEYNAEHTSVFTVVAGLIYRPQAMCHLSAN